ncbi:MAG: hypothetical protein FWD24_09025 [Treponema sp.]|nr:hypothetical protein [Treponema sp.]
MNNILSFKKNRNMSFSQKFELFKSNICHNLKSMGDLKFLISILETNKIQEYYNKKKYFECFYLLAMTDYISRENNIPLCLEYDHIRKKKLKNPVFPLSIKAMCLALNSNEPKERSLKECIPEFRHFNIIEAEVRNVY